MVRALERKCKVRVGGRVARGLVGMGDLMRESCGGDTNDRRSFRCLSMSWEAGAAFVDLTEVVLFDSGKQIFFPLPLITLEVSKEVFPKENLQVLLAAFLAPSYCRL